MTHDEIIEMAKLAGWEMDDSCVLSPQVLWYIYQGQLETFAKLVEERTAAKEREACAIVCDDINAKYKWPDDVAERVTSQWCADSIRSRGEAP